MVILGILIQAMIFIPILLIIHKVLQKYIDKLILTHDRYKNTYEYRDYYASDISFCIGCLAIGIVAYILITIFIYPYIQEYIFSGFWNNFFIGMYLVVFLVDILIKCKIFNLCVKYNKIKKKKQSIKEVREKIKSDCKLENKHDYVELLNSIEKEYDFVLLYICTLLGTKNANNCHISPDVYKKILEDMNNSQEKVKTLNKEIEKVIAMYVKEN